MTKSKEEMEHEKIDAEIKKLIAEERKVHEEIRVLKRPAILNPSVFVPLLIALISLFGTSLKWYQAEKQKQAAVSEKRIAVTEKQKAVLEEKATSAYASNLRNSVNQVQGSHVKEVEIKFRGSITREQITGLQLKLNLDAYTSPRPVRTTSIEATEIFYFDRQDLTKSEDIATFVTEYFQKLGCPLRTPIIPRLIKEDSINLAIKYINYAA